MGIGPIEMIIMLATLVFLALVIVPVGRFFFGSRPRMTSDGERQSHPQLKKCPGCGAELTGQGDNCPGCGLRVSG